MAEAVRPKSKKKGKPKLKEILVEHADPFSNTENQPSCSGTESDIKKELGTILPSIEDEIQQGAPITTESHKNITAKHIPNHLVEDEAKLFENGSERVFAKQENEAVLFQEGSKLQEASICENSIHEQLMELLIESPKIKPEIPSAPAPSMLNGTFEFNLDLPIEEKAADIVFPQSFENSISQAVYKQQQFNSLKPFTAEQLVSFYENPLLLGEEAVVESFLDCRKNLETHPLYENLTYFLRSRLMLKSNLEELEQFNRDVEALTSQLWTTETRRMIEYGECADSKRVKAHYDFPVAHLNEKSSLQLIRQLQQQREKIQEKLVLSVYESHLWRLRVDWLICQGSQHSEHGSISVLFAFLRRPVKDKMFVDHLKFWLNYVAVSLLKRARKEDYIFLAHHAVRCPTGLARWGSPYVQTPFYDPFEDRQGTNIHHVDVGLALLSILCQPVRSRQEFLQSWVDPDQDSHWVWLDSEGEDECSGNQTSVMNLTDDDLLSLLNQIPLANVFRFAFRLRNQDEMDVSTGLLEASEWLRAFAICRHLLKMFDSGMKTYQGKRYKNLAKKFGQLILHTVCNLSDFWQEQKAFVTSMGERLSREYEHLFLEGISLLIGTRQQRSWQLLSRIPLSGLTPRLRFELWLRWHSEIIGEPIEMDISDSFHSDSFWNLLNTKLVQLPEPDRFVFLVTLAEMASDGSTSSEDCFLQLVAWELTELGLLNKLTREVCFKTAAELLVTIISRFPPLVSFVLQRLEVQQLIPTASLSLFKDLPLHRWKPTTKDFQLLRNWLLNDALDSVRHQLTVTVLTRLNWTLEDNPKRPFLTTSFHQQTALLLTEVVAVHGRLPVPSAVPVLASNFLADSVQFLASFSRSWNSSSLVQWAWHLALKLRLHTFDCFPDHLMWILHHPQQAFRNVRQLQDDPQLSILRQPQPTPLSCFIALSMTNAGHSVPEFCSVGMDLLYILSIADQHRPVVAFLNHLFPLIVTCPDVLYDQPKLLEIFQRLIQADLTYYKRAKNLLAPQFPGVVLKMMASLIENTIWKLNGLYLTGATPALEIWLNLLTSLPKWNVDKSVLYLLDILARIAWANSSDIQSFNRILSVVLKESSKVHRPSKGIVSRVGNWVSGSSEALVQLDATELISPTPSLPYLSWIVLGMEMERQSKLWQHLIIELQPGKVKSIEQALKSIAGFLKIPYIGVHQLCLIRYAQMALELNPDHPLLPVIIQRFFSLYFARTEAMEVGTDSWAVGQRIMTNSSTFSSLLKRLVLKWEESAKKFQSDLLRSSFLQSCCLWVEDVKLLEPHVYLPSLAPNYHPARLLQLFQGSDLWIDLCDLNAIHADRQELRESWNKERNITSPTVSQQKSAESLHSQKDTIYARLQTYPTPIRLTQVALQLPFSRLLLTAFRNASDFRLQLIPHLQVIVDCADQFNRRMAELTSLDCHYSELLTELYCPYRSERTMTVKCDGTQSGACSGSAVIKLSCEPWRLNTSVRKQLDTNRQEATRLHSAFQDANVQWLCVAALLLEDCVDQIQGSSDPNVLETGAALFYILVELVGEESNNYLPTKQLLSTCLERLGQHCIAGHPEQCRNLVGLLSSNSNLAGLVAPHFTPSTPDPSSASVSAFLDSYRLVIGLSKQDSDLVLVLLTKFDVRWWLNCAECWPHDRLKLLEIIFAALDSYGLQPVERALAVHEVLRRHLQLILSQNFPEQYSHFLHHLLKASEAQSCSPVVWCDTINTLGQGWLRLQPELSMEEFLQQVLQYTTQQTLLDANKMMETVILMSQHFSTERQLHGLYGLYPKYRPYIHVIACFLLTIGHGLCFTTLQNDNGTASDLLVGQLWAAIRDLYSPWILPYTQQQVNSNCAAWIQHALSDCKVLLPWIAADSGLASLMASSLTHCTTFIHETLPAQQSILSHILAFYLQGFCHTAIKLHILKVIHQALDTLPWQSFVPSLNDLEQLVRVAGQFLPEVHSFLVSLFVRCCLSTVIVHCNSQPTTCARLLACLLHLHVRLAGEPTAQQNPMMKRILDEACSYPWQFIDASVYDQVLNWYISTCDPLFILQPYLERQETPCSSNDPLVFRLLQAVSSHHLQSSDHIGNSPKRQIFVRSWIRLIALTVSRHRSLIQQHPRAIPNAIGNLLDFICKNTHSAEYRNDIHEYMTVAISSSSPIADTLQNCLCLRMNCYPVNAALVENVLRVIAVVNGGGSHDGQKRMAAVLESALEQFEGTRSVIFDLLPIGGSKELAAVSWQQGCILSWYCLVSNQEKPDAADGPYLLEQMLSNCKALSLSEAIEPKLCFVYERLLTVWNLTSPNLSPKKTAVKAEWCELLGSWTEENKSWLSTIGLGKAPRLSSKGRCLAHVILCYLQQSKIALDQLENRWRVNRHNADCKPAVESALEALKSGKPDGIKLLQNLVPLLYSNSYLSRLIVK
ncbi:ectopic P granules protein 5 homolog isoform X2 [Daphnia magna]|uniref:ectopic P granules protein 5 homolog isoform X2 n=1 Tax=Daphnia magna TaxID=35525 RepID=UPI001E1BD532|nr:ectopic P granules protein 5 homolog isoform X2 [Daphnia magna]